jgi:hypothetical protein
MHSAQHIDVLDEIEVLAANASAPHRRSAAFLAISDHFSVVMLLAQAEIPQGGELLH